MKRLFFILIFLSIIIIVHPFKSYGETTHVDFIDVKIGSKEFNEVIRLYSEYGFNFYDRNNKDNAILEIVDNEIRVFFNSDTIKIFDVYGNLITTFHGDGSVIIGSGDIDNFIIKVDENRYRDYITFLNNGYNILIINHIYIENYLFGVLPREIPVSSPTDALRAQAVVARSFTYTSLNKHINEGYNLCNSTHCQVYGGYEWEKQTTNQAIIDTYGEYITYNGQVASAYYHSNSGGHTESSENVWGGGLPYLVGVEDIYSLNSTNSSWSLSLTPRELEDKLSANGINVGEIKDLQILNTTDSDRVEKVKIIGSTGEEVISGERLRTIIGTSSLKSTLFSVTKEGSSDTRKVYIVDGSGKEPKRVNLSGVYILDGYSNKTVNRSSTNRLRSDVSSYDIEGTVSINPTTFNFEGKGYGHGVGMSQYGAIEMAKSGYNYFDIIKHYYNGVEITNLGK